VSVDIDVVCVLWCWCRAATEECSTGSRTTLSWCWS